MAKDAVDTSPKGDEPASEQIPLKPARSVQKFLISSTCRFTGEFEADGLLITHAWPALRDRTAHIRWSEGPAARSAYSLVFRTDPEDYDGLVIPNYEHIGDMMCSYLSVLYGKRFDNHGAVEESGYFKFPDLNTFGLLSNPSLPQNTHKSRANCGFPLVLNEVSRLTPLLFGEAGHSEAAVAFRGAIKFYHQALQAAETDVEVAYLHLITAGEIISGAVEIPHDSLVDGKTREILRRIEAEMNDGVRTARVVRSKLRSVKRRFVAALNSLVDPTFFDRSEAGHPFGRLKSTRFVKVLGAAYDLRSRYVHTGHSFGVWVAPSRDNEEVHSGRPVVDDKEYGRILAAAPTYVGLERIIRYTLLKFAETLNVDLSIQESQNGN